MSRTVDVEGSISDEPGSDGQQCTYWNDKALTENADGYRCFNIMVGDP